MTRTGDLMDRYVQARRAVEAQDCVDEGYLNTGAAGRPGPLWVVLDAHEWSTRALFDVMCDEELTISYAETRNGRLRVQLFFREYFE